MHLSWSQLAGGVLAACLCCAGALAQPPGVQNPTWLTVTSEGDPCIEGPELVQEVLRLLGSETPPAGVKVDVQAFDDRVHFRLTQGSGGVTTRDLTDLPRECAARREAVSLVLALAIEHAVAEERRRQAERTPEPPVPPAPSSDVSSPAVQPADTPSEAPLEAKSPAPLGAQVRLLGGFNVGLLPRPAAEGRVEGELSLGARWAFVVAAGLTSATRSSVAEGQLVARALWSSLGVCFGGATGAGRLHGCLDVGLGAVLGRGRDLAQNRRDTTASGTLELGVLGRWPLTAKLALVWRLSAVSQWLRPRYEALTEGALGQAEVAAATTFPPFGGRALLGLAWQIR